MNRSLHLWHQEVERRDKIAVIYGDQRISFAQLASQTREMARQLAAFGVKSGDRVGVMIPNCPDFIIVQQALFTLGAVFSPINIYYQPAEVAYSISSCELSFLVMPPELLERIHSLRGHDISSLRKTLVLTDGTVRDQAGIAASKIEAFDPTPVGVEPGDVVMLLHTSATTGKSKGVMLTAANLAANYDKTPGWLGLDESSVILCALPLYNTFGLNQCINAMLVTGATLVLLARFDANHCIDAISCHHCTFLPAVPTMLQKIFDDPRATRWRLESLDTILTGGAPVPAALLQRVERAIGTNARLLTGYGLTEGTALVTLTRVQLDDAGNVIRGRTIGCVLDGMELAILDPNSKQVETGSIGEICVRGPNVMSGYYGSPSDSAVALAGGWLHSGDLGTIDADGFVTIVDRIKDVIIRGGQNIYPADIEEVLYQCPDVTEAAVIARSHELLGEVPVAYVALKPGSNLSVGEMIDHCSQALAPFKIPAEIRVIASLPKGPTGKILRRQLRADREVAA